MRLTEAIELMAPVMVLISGKQAFGAVSDDDSLTLGHVG